MIRIESLLASKCESLGATASGKAHSAKRALPSMSRLHYFVIVVDVILTLAAYRQVSAQ